MKKVICLLLLCNITICKAEALGDKQSTLSVVKMKCEYIDNPSGIDVISPMLSWRLEERDSFKRGSKQTAYQILIASSIENIKKGIGDIYTTEKKQTSEIRHFLDEISLKSSSKYWWKIRVWNEADVISEWSEPAYFITGIFPGEKWFAEWISAAGAEKYAMSYKSARNDFHVKKEIAEIRANIKAKGELNYNSLLAEKDIEVKSKPSSALIHISGLGHYELSVNGKKVGNYKLTPGWTNYQKTVLYDTYEISDLLKKGGNKLSVILGNGMYNIQPDTLRYVKFLNTFGPLKVIAQLHLEYPDGTKEIIGTDKTWRVAPGPITYSNVFGGEDYDARLLPIREWYEPLICKGPGGSLRGLMYAAPPIKEIEILKSTNVKEIKPNIYIYDLGQNASIMPRIKVQGKAGSYIRIIPSELLGADGLIDRKSSTQNGIRPAWWQYTLSGHGEEYWYPQFFYNGGRYLQVEIYANENGDLPVVKELEGVVVHASSEPIGTFESSNDLFNKIYTLVKWAQRSNMMSVMTDCPTREKLGWLEQIQLNGPALRYNFDMASIFRKTMRDMEDSQLDYGLIPNIAPEFYMVANPNQHPPGAFRNSPEWGSAFIIIPWHQYLFSGDTTLLEHYYDSMKRYVAFLAVSARENIIYTGLGDWCDQGPQESWFSQLTPVEFTATATYFYDNVILSKIAELLEKKEDEQIYRLKAEEIRKSFNDKFFNKESGTYSTNSQTANAIPIAMGIVEPENKSTVLASILNDIRNRGNIQTSGEIGYPFLLRTLADEGHSEIIFDINNQTNKPGYGYQLKMGATSLAEKWGASISSDGFGSQNHFMLGQINEWFFQYLIGISNDERGPGFKSFIIKPAYLKSIDWVKGSFNSTSGMIEVYWCRKGKGLNIEISIPTNTKALLHIPILEDTKITESNIPIEKVKEVAFIENKNGNLIYLVESGKYNFIIQ